MEIGIMVCFPGILPDFDSIIQKDGVNLPHAVSVVDFLQNEPDYELRTNMDGQKVITFYKTEQTLKTLSIVGNPNMTVISNQPFVSGHPIHRPPTH